MSSIGLVPGGSPRDLTMLATPEPADPGAIKSLDQKMFWHAPSWAGRNRSVRASAAKPPPIHLCDRRELGCSATIGARPMPILARSGARRFRLPMRAS